LSRQFMRKEISIGLPESIFDAESIDVIMFTDGGIANLNEVLGLFEERAEINRATIVLSHGFKQEHLIAEPSKIRVVEVSDEKEIPHIVIRDTQMGFNALQLV